MEHEYDPENYAVTVVKRGDGSFSVSLPHQCDEWEVIGGPKVDTPPWTHREQDKTEALRQLRAFISGLERAAAVLMNLASGPIAEPCVDCGNADQMDLQLWPCYHVVCRDCDFTHGKVLSRDHRGALESITILNEQCTREVRMSPEERPT